MNNNNIIILDVNENNFQKEYGILLLDKKENIVLNEKTKDKFKCLTSVMTIIDKYKLDDEVTIEVRFYHNDGCHVIHKFVYEFVHKYLSTYA